MVPKIVGLLKGDNSPHSQNMMTRLAELLNILMYLHAGFPELYDPVYESIKVLYVFGYKMCFFAFQNNLKNLDPSYKMDLELWIVSEGQNWYCNKVS